MSDKGTEATVDVPPEVSDSGLAKGDQLVLLRTPAQDGQPAILAYYEIERSTSLWLVGGLFVVVVLAVARLRGLMALVGLGVAGAVIGGFVIPALLAGEPAVPVALVALGGDHVRRPLHDPRRRPCGPVPRWPGP